jgi:hypothetical protein
LIAPWYSGNGPGGVHNHPNLGAEPLYRRALAIQEKALGPDYPDTAISLNHLAGVGGQLAC